jgi:hypothetical protein
LFDRLTNLLFASPAVRKWFGNLVTMTWWDEIWLNEGVTEMLFVG